MAGLVATVAITWTGCVRMRASVKKAVWAGAVILPLAILVLYALFAAAWNIMTSGDGDMFDRFKVISTLRSPDAKTVAVAYDYGYAELSASGYSVWLQGADQAVEDSESGWPKGKPLFTVVNSATPPAFQWTLDGHIAVAPGTAIVVRTVRSNECFWNSGEDERRQVLCLHSPLVVATEGKAAQ